MDFFARQDRARRRTRALIAAFAVAVVALVAVTNLAVALPMRFLPWTRDPDTRFEVHLVATIATVGVIGVGSLMKIIELAAGGGAGLAQRLGGRLIAAGSADRDERRLLDIVEEMAIASGVPVPPVYVLPGEDEINGFAAGFGPRDAVIGVTHGAVLALSRDELQGVVAHEFSHLLNGDTRLDLRLIGVLHGILLIGQIGQSLVVSGGSRRSSWGGDDEDGDRGVDVVSLALGGSLMAIGALGTFVGEVIRAGVARSREFLADASAVQFTRQASGIAGALKRVGGTGSAVLEPTALEARHVFFASAVGGGLLNGLLATHPPIADRIRAIEPGWDGRFLVAPRPVEQQAERAVDAAAGALARIAAAAAGRGAAVGALAGLAASARAGRVDDRAIAAGSALIGALPQTLIVAARDAQSARAVVCALTFGRDPAARARQLAALRDRDAPTAELAARLAGTIDGSGDGVRLPLLDLCAPALATLSTLQRGAFATTLRAVIAADADATIDQWLLARLALARLGAQLAGGGDGAPLWLSAAIVLAVLARAGAGDEAAAASAYAAARAQIVELPPSPPPVERCTPPRLDAALARLTGTIATFKRRFVDATVACIDADGTRTAREVELERVVCACLGVPMPLG